MSLYSVTGKQREWNGRGENRNGEVKCLAAYQNSETKKKEEKKKETAFYKKAGTATETHQSEWVDIWRRDIGTCCNLTLLTMMWQLSTCQILSASMVNKGPLFPSLFNIIIMNISRLASLVSLATLQQSKMQTKVFKQKQNTLWKQEYSALLPCPPFRLVRLPVSCLCYLSLPLWGKRCGTQDVGHVARSLLFCLIYEAFPLVTFH